MSKKFKTYCIVTFKGSNRDYEEFESFEQFERKVNKLRREGVKFKTILP